MSMQTLLISAVLTLFSFAASADYFKPTSPPPIVITTPLPLLVCPNSVEDASIGYCAGDPVNRTDPMGTDYIHVNNDTSIVYWVVMSGKGAEGSELARFPIGKRSSDGWRRFDTYAFFDGMTLRDDGFSVFSEAVRNGDYESTRLSGRRSLSDYADAMVAGYQGFRNWWHPAAYRAHSGQSKETIRQQAIEEARPLAGAIENDIGVLKYWARGWYRAYNFVAKDALSNQDKLQAELYLANYFAARHERSVTLTEAQSQTRGNVVEASVAAFTMTAPFAAAPEALAGRELTIASNGGTWAGNAPINARVAMLQEQLLNEGKVAFTRAEQLTFKEIGNISSGLQRELYVTRIGQTRYLNLSDTLGGTHSLLEGEQYILHTHPGEGFWGLTRNMFLQDFSGLPAGQTRAAVINESGAGRIYRIDETLSDIFNASR